MSKIIRCNKCNEILELGVNWKEYLKRNKKKRCIKCHSNITNLGKNKISEKLYSRAIDKLGGKCFICEKELEVSRVFPIKVGEKDCFVYCEKCIEFIRLYEKYPECYNEIFTSSLFSDIQLRKEMIESNKQEN